MIIVGDVENLESQAVSLRAAIHHLSQIAGIDVGKNIYQPKLRILHVSRKVCFVLVGFDHVVDS